jgi:hypothetical protein
VGISLLFLHDFVDRLLLYLSNKYYGRTAYLLLLAGKITT